MNFKAVMDVIENNERLKVFNIPQSYALRNMFRAMQESVWLAEEVDVDDLDKTTKPVTYKVGDEVITDYELFKGTTFQIAATPKGKSFLSCVNSKDLSDLGTFIGRELRPKLSQNITQAELDEMAGGTVFRHKE